jgi:hypothetical protein
MQASGTAVVVNFGGGDSLRLLHATIVGLAAHPTDWIL